MVKNRYWYDREQLINVSIDTVEELLKAQYIRAAEELELKMSNLYMKIMSEARDKVLVSDLYKYNRYAELMDEITLRLKKLGRYEKRLLGREMSTLYRGTFGIVGKEVNYVTILNEDAVKKALADIWTPDGAKWSDRIWSNKAQLQQSLANGLVDCVATGASPDKLAEMVMQRCGASYNNSKRLARTELSHIYNKAAYDKYKEAGISKYIYLTGHDETTCSECGALDGMEFPLDEAEVGINYPPLHVNCRCTVLAKE